MDLGQLWIFCICIAVIFAILVLLIEALLLAHVQGKVDARYKRILENAVAAQKAVDAREAEFLREAQAKRNG